MACRLFLNYLLTWCLMWRKMSHKMFLESTNHCYFSTFILFYYRDVAISTPGFLPWYHFTAVMWHGFLDIILLLWCDIFYLDIILLPWWTIFYLDIIWLPWCGNFYLVLLLWVHFIKFFKSFNILTMISHFISSLKPMVDDTRDQGELGFRGKWMFCSILIFHVRDMLSSRLISDIYTLF